MNNVGFREGLMGTKIVNEIPSAGYGNHTAKISFKNAVESGRLTSEVLAYANEIIQSGECMVSITEPDDGCIDGRLGEKVLFINDAWEMEERPIEDPSDHQRAKVAGGGYFTALSMRRATEPASQHIDDDISETVEQLTEEDIYCGTHTGDHSGEDTVDCGANDKIEPILENAVLYAREIADDTAVLLNEAGIIYDGKYSRDIVDGWSETLNHPEYFEGSTGASRYDRIIKGIQKTQAQTGQATRPVSVSKHLGGGHKEFAIVVNFIEGQTFSQGLFAKLIADRFKEVPTESIPDVFVVDVPRIAELSKAMAGRVPKQDFEEKYMKNLYAGIGYQLATAATLTDGTLPRFIVK